MKSTKFSQQLFFPFMEIEKEQTIKKASSPRKTKASSPCNKDSKRFYTKSKQKTLSKVIIKTSVTKTGVTTVTINVNKEIK